MPRPKSASHLQEQLSGHEMGPSTLQNEVRGARVPGASEGHEWTVIKSVDNDSENVGALGSVRAAEASEGVRMFSRIGSSLWNGDVAQDSLFGGAVIDPFPYIASCIHTQ